MKTILKIAAALSIAAAICAAQDAEPAAQTVTGFAPASAPVGAAVAITGTGFVAQDSVYFNGVKAVSQTISATQITAIVPAKALAGKIQIFLGTKEVAASSAVFYTVLQTWDAVKNFSDTANPNGAWTYGYASKLEGTFLPFTTNFTSGTTIGWSNNGAFPNYAGLALDNTPYTLFNSNTIIIPVGVLALGIQQDAVLLRWTAPATGTYSIIGSFQGIDLHLPVVDVGVYENGNTVLYSNSLSFFGDLLTFDVSNIALVAGATIDFAGAYTTTPSEDNATVTATINQVQ
ncbi:MAG: IPT/TIG domain-containing protein [Bryobacteraceae bacterium]|jgi:IPT/TIG domain-containing protein